MSRRFTEFAFGDQHWKIFCPKFSKMFEENVSIARITSSISNLKRIMETSTK